MSARSSRWWALLGLGLLLCACQNEVKLATTVADLQIVHGGVSLGGASARGVARVADGAVVQTDEQGRARLRLDDGSSFVIDVNTKLGIAAARTKLESGRLFVLGAPGARTEVELGQAVVVLTGGNAAIARPAQALATARVYAASGELTVRVGAKDFAVRTGESASIDAAAVSVAPERAFDDWTGGLAAPWGATGKPARAVGELWGRAASAPLGDIGSPLTIRAETVTARVFADAAETEVTMVFFHSGSAPVLGDFRMALPVGAVVSGFAVGRGEALSEGRVLLAAREDGVKPEALGPASRAVLEWAGDGWVRGSLPSIPPGAVVHVVVRYTEWLTPRPGADGKSVVVQYRLPLVGEVDPPLVGEFAARIDAAAAAPLGASAGLGARATGSVVELRKSDFRPTADLVADFALPAPEAPARVMVVPASAGDDNGAYVLARAEVPAAKAVEGVSLVLLVDSSASVDADMLEAERAFVEAVTRGLGPRDRLLVLAMDQTVWPVGPATLGEVDEARRQAILAALGSLEPAGATDLGRAIELAADAMDPKRPDAMLVVVGDGWPTMGDLEPREIRARLGRRPTGMPRLGAVAVGPIARRAWLGALVRGSGPLLELGDRPSAASAAAALMSKALQPTVGAVELGLGPTVDQIYPLHPRALEAGSTVFAIGRLRGSAPREITLRWQDGEGAHESRLRALQQPQLGAADVGRRWALARAEELTLRVTGREAVTDVALRAGLLTPWTAWVVDGRPGETYGPTPIASRALDLATGGDAVFSAVLGSHGLGGAALVDLSEGFGAPATGADRGGDDDTGLERAVQAAAKRALDDAVDAIRACRDSRAALRPELAGTLQIRFELDGGGQASAVKIDGDRSSYDEALYRCLTSVVTGLHYPPSGAKTKIGVLHLLELPAPRTTQRTKCSATSTLPVALRRGVWVERLGAQSAEELYLEAKRGCELGDWTARRSLLELVLDRVRGAWRVALARTLERAGERDAATFLRREALRRARSPDELRAVRLALLRDEQYPIGTFEKQYGEAKNDSDRLAVVRRFLELAPHDVRLGRQQLVLLEALGRKDALHQEIARIRRDPFADASLLGECAAMLHRAGNEVEARRAFGEIVERAPRDPWARAFAGDRMRNEGWFEEASAAYGALAAELGAEPLVLLRVALAHAGAGRLDLAARVLANLTQVGGRDQGGQLAGVATDLGALLLIQRGLTPGSELKVAPTAEQQAELERRVLELPRSAQATSVLLRLPAASAPIEVVLLRGPKEAREQRRPTVAIPELGIYRFALGPEDLGGTTLRLVVPKQLAPARPLRATIDTVSWKGGAELPELRSRELELRPTGKPLELSWRDGAWQ